MICENFEKSLGRYLRVLPIKREICLGASNHTGDILDASNRASVCRCYIQKGRLASVFIVHKEREISFCV